MKMVITAIGNQRLNTILKNEKNINILTNDISYPEGILETIEKYAKVEYCIISEDLVKNNTIELIKRIIEKVKNIKIIFIKVSKNEIKDLSKIENVIIMENNFLVRDLIKKITNENSDNIEVINVLEEKIKKTNFNRLVKNIVKNKKETKVISILGSGGTGKSITCVNIANSLNKNKILIIDFDILNNSLSTILGVHQYSQKIEKRLKNNTLINNKIDVKDLLIKINKNIDLISGINLIFDTRYQISSIKIKDIFNELKEYYDVIIVDTSCECFFDYTKEIILNSDNSIFLVESNLVEIKKAKNLLEIYSINWNIPKSKIQILINKFNDNSIDENILSNIFYEFKIIGKINFSSEFNNIINKNKKTRRREIEEQYKKINNKVIKINFNNKRKIFNYLRNKIVR